MTQSRSIPQPEQGGETKARVNDEENLGKKLLSQAVGGFEVRAAPSDMVTPVTLTYGMVDGGLNLAAQSLSKLECEWTVERRPNNMIWPILAPPKQVRSEERLRLSR